MKSCPSPEPAAQLGNPCVNPVLFEWDGTREPICFQVAGSTARQAHPGWAPNLDKCLVQGTWPGTGT